MMYERDYIKRPILYWSFFVVQIPDRLGMTEREATPKDDKGKDPVQDDGGRSLILLTEGDFSSG